MPCSGHRQARAVLLIRTEWIGPRSTAFLLLGLSGATTAWCVSSNSGLPLFSVLFDRRTLQFPSNGNYSSYEDYWHARLAWDPRWPTQGVSTEIWNSCDPFHMREVALWHETYGSATNASVSVSSDSIYMIQFTLDTNSSELLAVRQAYWCAGTVEALLCPADETYSSATVAPCP
jgi:hypothetical protein